MGFLSRSTEIRPTLCRSIHNPPPIYKKYPRELDHPAPQSCVENYVSPIKSLSIWRITELRKSCTSYTAILASSYLRDRSKLTSDVTILRPFLCAKDRSLQAIYLITIARNAFNDAKRTEWAMHEIFQWIYRLIIIMLIIFEYIIQGERLIVVQRIEGGSMWKNKSKMWNKICSYDASFLKKCKICSIP